jgi:hypothetical protein
MPFRFADNTNPATLSARFRQRRIQLFKAILPAHDDASILDVGGAPWFWQQMGLQLPMTIVNLVAPEGDWPEGIEFVEGDARDLSRYGDDSFDVVFSNSVLEHVGSFDDQAAMAREVRRVGRRYFVQAPNYYFPVEPHFLFPGFQFAPRWLRRAIARTWPFGWGKRGSEAVMHDADTIRLPTARRMQQLFPDAFILGEAIGPLNKSLIAIRSDRLPANLEGFRVLASP